MKILHILDHSIPLHSGYTFRTRSILLEQAKKGWETVHITSEKHYSGDVMLEVIDGLNFYRTPKRGGFIGRVPIVNQVEVINSLTKRMSHVVAQEKPDILHAHSPCLNGIAALRVGRNNNLPVVYECRAFWEDAAVDHGTIREGGPRYLLTRWLETQVFKRADAVTAICEGLRAEILGRGISEKKIDVIPNAVNIEAFTATLTTDEKIVRELGLEGKTVIGFIGSFYHYEGLQILIQSLPEIREAVKNVHLLFVGGGPEEKYLKDEANRSSCRDIISFAGRVPHEKVQDYYRLFDVLVYPRMPMRLTELVTPLKPLEAMALGKVVVASDVGGHKELIKDGWNGILFRAGKVDNLAAAIKSLCLGQIDSTSLRMNGRKYVEQERNWQYACAPYEAIYSKLLG